ncbi:MAG: diaminopimelate decarboxylase [Clostridia bacterium]|nr:diaminopimelate decarboxylase [Clostridia bacterium]
MENQNLLYDNLKVCDNGELIFAGVSTTALAKEFKTPLYVLDEELIRNRCKEYVNAVNQAFDGNASVLYASKALSFKKIYSIIQEEGLGIDVVSQGEIYTAKIAGFNMQNAYFHSNNKTDEDIEFALDNGVGFFVVDNEEELVAINEISNSRGVTTNVLLRITPGIDPHTYEEVATGKVDSKFGSAIETGQAEEIVKMAISLQNINLEGLHCHVGSQVFDGEVYKMASEVMLNFIALIKNKYNYTIKKLDLGGGFGVKYVSGDGDLDIQKSVSEVATFVKNKVLSLGIKMPHICFEPGRSIVADAGITLYTVGTVKRITGYKNYVSVDGGMTDNPRYALYKSKYTILPAYNMNKECDMLCSVVGRCCESGDILQEDVYMPSTIKRGDIIACLTTGAYNYAMSSNYNRLTKPAIVMIKDKKAEVVVERQSLEHLTMLDK